MGDIKAGVVVVTKFVSADNKKTGKYIDYIDRPTAKRAAHIKDFNLYQDYMGNPEKTSGLFTKESDDLSDQQKGKLKELFQLAQDRGSLMWQTVISFDNRWLIENGIMSEDGLVDESSLRKYVRNAMGKMLKNEALDNAIWSAAFHYNTDNLHVHIATVELNPTRAMIVVDGEEMRKGRFKRKSIEMCKSSVVNDIIRESSLNRSINSTIRDIMVAGKKNNPLIEDKEMVEQFMKIYKALPEKRSLWNYGNNALAKLRPMIDELSSAYIEKYHKEDLKQLKEFLFKMDGIYKTAYGKNTSSFSSGKMDDLYKRLGNAILKEMKAYDKNANLSRVTNLNGVDTGVSVELDVNTGDINRVLSDVEVDSSGFQYESWLLDKMDFKSEEYKALKKALYSRKADKDYKSIYLGLVGEAAEGNILAAYDMADMARFGLGMEPRKELADALYKKCLSSMKELYGSSDADLLSIEALYDRNRNRSSRRLLDKEKKAVLFLKDYLPYKIGKMYIQGLGCEKDINKGLDYLCQSDNAYARYTEGSIYYFGAEGIRKNIKKAVDCFKQSNTPFSFYRLGRIYEVGEGEIDASESESNKYYQAALDSFLKLEEKQGSGDIQYRIGKMYLQGKGCAIDTELGMQWINYAAHNGNAMAQYELAKAKLASNDENEKIEARSLLEKAAYKGRNELAMYSLARLYAVESEEKVGDAIKLLEPLSKKMDCAAYSLGKIYLKDIRHKNSERAVELLSGSALSGNEYSAVMLGCAYLSGELGERNFEKAKEWLEKAPKNQIAKNILEDISTEKAMINSGSSGRHTPRRSVPIIDYKTRFYLEMAMRDLKRSLNNNYEKWKLIQEHDYEFQLELEEREQSV